jgi:hypothetical protein
MRLCSSLLAVLAAVQTSASLSAVPNPPAGCDTPESHQWDFWVGKWEVRPRGADKVIAHSLIEKKYSGCAIRENWMPIDHELAGGGGSLSIYDPRLGQWRQTWMDSAGSRVQLDGGFHGGVMTITGTWANFIAPGQDALVRMNYQKLPDGEVRQWAQSSVDGGKTWKPSFDFVYRKIEKFPAFR